MLTNTNALRDVVHSPTGKMKYLQEWILVKINNYGGPFTYEEVEDVKTFFRLLMLILSLFGFLTTNAHLINSFFNPQSWLSSSNHIPYSYHEPWSHSTTYHLVWDTNLSDVLKETPVSLSS